MAAAKGNDEHVKTDKHWNAHLMCKLAGMLTEKNFRDLKQVFHMTDQLPRRDVEMISDFNPFWDALERLDHISVGRYGVLIQHLEMLQLNDCIRVIKEHTQKIEEYRQQQSSRRTPSSGAEGPVPSSSDRKTRLMRAAEGNDLASVRNLIEAGADVDIKGGRFFLVTALMLASEKGHKEVVAELIKAGADVNIKDTLDKTALMLASHKGHKDIVAELIKAGADVNMKDRFVETALTLASQKGHEVIVAELIKAGADVNTKDEDGVTALGWAEERGHSDIVRRLKEAGARR